MEFIKEEPDDDIEIIDEIKESNLFPIEFIATEIDPNLDFISKLNTKKIKKVAKCTVEKNRHLHPLEEFLNTSMMGRIVLSYYHKKRVLKRAWLSKILIDKEMKAENDYIISRSRFFELAEQIAEFFKGESPDQYFCLNKKGIYVEKLGPKGILYDRYCETRSHLIKCGMVKPRKEFSKGKRARPENITISDEEKHSLEFLENYVEPESEIRQKWDETSYLRRTNKTMSYSYYKNFKCLRSPDRYQMMISNFDSLHGKLSNKLFEKWKDFTNTLIFMTRNRNDNLINEFLAKYKTTIDNGNLNVVGFLLLPLMLGSVYRRARKSDKTAWWPTKLEVQKSFFLHIQTPGELESYKIWRKKVYDERELDIPPYVALCGPLEGTHVVYLIIHDYEYEMPSPLFAMDACFKCMNVLKATYPFECPHAWTFLQKFIYELDTHNVQEYATVNKLITDINHLKAMSI